MKTIIFFGVIVAGLVMSACSDFLEVEPKDRLSAASLLSSDEGIEAYMASMYDRLPIEDFRFDYREGFNFGGNTGGMISANTTPDVIHSEWGDHAGEPNRFNYWEAGYRYIRDINNLKDAIPVMKPSNPATRVMIRGEAHLFMAYTYFQLAKRYGGVSLIKELQQFDGDYEKIKVPRSTEKETWNYVLAECDSAAALLPSDNGRRGTKWVALALKSRAALFAASVAKFWPDAALTGEAVTKKLVGGMDASDAQHYYEECIEACQEIIGSGKFDLYKPAPASQQEASENYRKIFADARSTAPEIIFSKGYFYPGVGHSMGSWHEPNQLSREYGGRACVTLELVDTYENIDGAGNGSGNADAKISTRVDGNEDYFGFDNAANFKKFDTPYEIFDGKDPRLYATVILPGTSWKGTTITIQGGIVRADGSRIFLGNDPYEFGGQTYYGKGDASESKYSGWVQSRSNGTITGFLLKKYMNNGDDQNRSQVTTEYPDFRYAEILLNYAEALVESGLAAPGGIIDGKEALNKTRHRAGFTDDLDLTVDNVQRERRIEMAVEYTRPWDLVRRREFHTIFTGSYNRHALVPMLDFTVSPPKYIFVRYAIPEPGGSKKFETKVYYRPIPGIEGNSVVQNPNY